MLRANLALIAMLGMVAPAAAQLAGPAVPSYNPGVPSYSPGVPGQARGAFSRRDAFRRAVPRRVYPPVVVPYGYGHQTIIVVPPTVVFPAPRRRTTMDNPFFGDLGDPFF